MKKNDLIFIQDQIGYKFKNLNLLQQAFTRRSYSEENGGENNEILEFIGDKVLDFFVVKLLITENSNSANLFKKFDPNLKNSIWGYETERKNFPEENTFICDNTEAELTEMKKLLVQKKTLARRVEQLGIDSFLLMGKGDVLRNINEENSVKEDLFEAILGAVAIDSNWNMEALQSTTEIMLAPEYILSENDSEDYVNLIQEWTVAKTNCIPLYHFEDYGYSGSWYILFDGISQQPKSFFDSEINQTKYCCLLKISDSLPKFRGFGQSRAEAKKNVCKVAYEYLCKNGLWLSIRDEIDNPNKNDAINQLEILARRGYFSVPEYEFEQKYDKNGNPIWICSCNIEEKDVYFTAKSSSKKNAKKDAAYKMLRYVLSD